MSDALLQSSYAVEAAPTRRRALPRGYGLLAGAAVSIGLWGGIIWAVALAFG